jgi:AP-3 complex subunit delta-1
VFAIESLFFFTKVNLLVEVSIMFEKSLTDLVKGIRAHKHNEEAYIRNAIAEIKNELKTSDIKKKAVAIQKLTYLHMMGYDMEWAAFQILEVLSANNFSYKRIGYLAASQCFTKDTDVMVLTPQTFRKDLKSGSQYETGLVIQCLSNICTPDLARDLVSEIVSLLNSTKAYVRKKAVLVLYKIFLQYPDALRPAFPRLKEKLADPHPSVVSASVNVICELARKNPHNYLGMAPVFFKLLTSLNNNWTTIKIVKLFGALAPHEPRLAKKLVEPMANLIQTTPAKSLLYECLYTVTKGMAKHMTVVKLAVEKLKLFIEDTDQNLKYLGLLGLNNLMDHYPRIIADIKDTILACLNDEDITIRFRALDLICGVVNQKNLKSIISRLVKILDEINQKGSASIMEEQYKDHLIQKIIHTCSKDNYANITNFKWYLEILIHLTQIKSATHGKLIAAQLIDVLIRVKSIRDFGVQEMIKLLSSPQLQTESLETSAVFEVLYAAAWLTGEFISDCTTHEELTILQALTQPTIFSLPLRIQSSYILTIVKIYTHAAKSAEQEESVKKNLPQIVETTQQGLQMLLRSSDVEIQERAVSCLKLVEIHQELLKDGIDIIDELQALFEDKLNPVAPKAQRKLQETPPQELNLDAWIGTPFSELIDEHVFKQQAETYTTYEQEEVFGESYEEEKRSSVVGGDFGGYQEAKNIFMLKGDKKSKVDPSIPTHNLSELGVKTKKTKKKSTKGTKGKKKRTSKEEETGPVEISNVIEAPEGIDLSEPAQETIDPIADRLSKIDLTKPIDPNEKLYEVQAYPLRSEAKELSKKIQAKKSTRPATKEETKAEGKKKVSKKSSQEDGEKKKKKKSSKTGEKKTSTKKSTSGGKTTKKEENIINMFEEVKSPPSPSASAATTSNNGRAQSPVKEATQSKKAPSKKTSSLKRLCKDENLRLSIDTKAQPSDANHISLPVTFENTNSNLSISELAYNINGTMNMKLIRPDNSNATGPVALNISLTPGTSTNVLMSFEFKSFLRAQELPGVINYTLSNGERRQIQFTLPMPSSMFIKSKKITSEELANLAKAKAISNLNATNVQYKGKIDDVNEVARAISKLIHVSVVERIEDEVYQMYGQSVQGHHVAVQVKDKGSKEATVELRCSEDSLGTSLITEIHRHFKQI